MKHFFISPTERLEWVDIYKGIGIILVVIGHVYRDIKFDLIFLFHMPLFFFISGLMFKKPENFSGFARKRARQLLVPYCTFLGLNYAFYIGLQLYSDPENVASIISLVTEALAGGRSVNKWALAYWFITCFFATLLLEVYLIKRFSKKTLIILHFLMLTAGYANWYFLRDVIVAEDLNVVLGAAPIFYTGYLFKDFRPTSRTYIISYFLGFLGFAAIALNHHMAWHINMYFDMKVGYYGIPYLTFIAAIACCVSLVHFSQMVAKQKILAKFFAEFGRASLIIMFVHCFIIRGVPFVDDPHYNLLRTLLGIFGSYAIYVVIKKFSLTRKYLMGIS